MKNLILTLCVILSIVLNLSAQDSPLQITFQPKPEFPENFGTLDVQGTVMLRVEFLNNGEIGKLATVVGLPSGLTEKAISAAQKIKFNPEIKKGQTVTVFKQIQYFYGWDGGWRILQNKVNKNAEQIVQKDDKAETIVQKAVEKLGGAKYLQVKNIVSTGNYTLFRAGTADLPSSFIDVISFPLKERTEFKKSGSKTVQTNSGENGWIYDAGTQTLRDQNPAEIANFKQTMRTSLDNILRGGWRSENAKLSYVGKRAATLGKRNDVVKLVYPDGFTVEYEFDGTDGMPMKSVFDGKDDDGAAAKEEERYAQFVNVQGVAIPFIVDRWTGGKQVSRINYSKIEINKNVSDSIFTKPADVKSLKKDLKL
jgi:Gram-negative bacterial TonB protein C-terminal